MTQSTPDYSNHFSLENLPYGVASSPHHLHPQCVTRLYNDVIFLGDLQRSGYFNDVSSLPPGVFDQSTLNSYAALPKAVHREVRRTLQRILKGDSETRLQPHATEHISVVNMHLPIAISGFTDFSCSLNHVQNAGRAILNDPTPPPGFFHFPIGYTGRASSIVVSGTPVTRPKGHFYDRSAPGEKKPVIFAPSRALDYELELGAIIGVPVEHGKGLSAKDAEEHVFGLVILNDWSARDIQGLEMPPLGPLNGKSFATSISPWVVTLDALSGSKTPAPSSTATISGHLQGREPSNYAIEMNVELLTGQQSTATTLSTSNAKDLYWSIGQMCAHLASCGCGLQTGDVLGTGTVSGQHNGELGCLLEITQGGKVPVNVGGGGEERVFLQDGDVVKMSALAGEGIGFGECVGEIRSG